ncbi:hypothetical protein GCM10007919_02610 [Rhizobium indigoferae]|nr:hypothetical protein GCM10007919_02610 [Rhizobium indigoferae]
MLGKSDRQCSADALTGAGDEDAAAGEIEKGKGHEAALILGGQLEKRSTGCYFETFGTAFKPGGLSRQLAKRGYRIPYY